MPRAAFSTAGTGAVFLSSTRDISLAPGSQITTEDGSISLWANQQIVAPAGVGFVGIDLDNATVDKRNRRNYT